MGSLKVVEAHDVYRFFRTATDDVVALRGVSLTVDEREIVAVVGPSGSGKSTLLSCVCGLDDPDGGWVAIAGERMSHRSEREKAALRARTIGVLLQTANLF